MPTLVGRPERSKDSRLKSRLDVVNGCGVLDLRPNRHGLVGRRKEIDERGFSLASPVGGGVIEVAGISFALRSSSPNGHPGSRRVMVVRSGDDRVTVRHPCAAPRPSGVSHLGGLGHRICWEMLALPTLDAAPFPPAAAYPVEFAAVTSDPTPARRGSAAARFIARAVDGLPGSLELMVSVFPPMVYCRCL